MIQLQRAASDPAMRRLGGQDSVLVHGFGRLANTPAIRRHPPCRDRRLRARAAVEQTTLDEKQIDASLQDRTLGTASSHRA